MRREEKEELLSLRLFCLCEREDFCRPAVEWPGELAFFSSGLDVTAATGAYIIYKITVDGRSYRAA